MSTSRSSIFQAGLQRMKLTTNDTWLRQSLRRLKKKKKITKLILLAHIPHANSAGRGVNQTEITTLGLPLGLAVAVKRSAINLVWTWSETWNQDMRFAKKMKKHQSTYGGWCDNGDDNEPPHLAGSTKNIANSITHSQALRSHAISQKTIDLGRPHIQKVTGWDSSPTASNKVRDTPYVLKFSEKTATQDCISTILSFKVCL